VNSSTPAAALLSSSARPLAALLVIEKSIDPPFAGWYWASFS
jgi:hypothetical protein